MIDADDANLLARDLKNDSEISGSNAIMAFETMPKWFGARDIRPTLQAIHDIMQSIADYPGKRLHLPVSLGCQNHVGHPFNLSIMSKVSIWRLRIIGKVCGGTAQ
jgi:hypothetical protein